MNTPDLDAIAARLAAATPDGMFALEEDKSRLTVRTGKDSCIALTLRCRPLADFISHAPADIAALLEYARRLEARAKQSEAQRDWILEYFLDAYGSEPPCCIPGAACPFPESTRLRCENNEGPRNLDYKPCWLAAASQAREGAKS